MISVILLSFVCVCVGVVNSILKVVDGKCPTIPLANLSDPCQTFRDIIRSLRMTLERVTLIFR